MKYTSLLAIFAIFASTFVFANQSYASDRQTYTAWQWQRGSTVNVPESVVRELCGDWDGCTIRMGMWNWDGTRRTASRESLFYYDSYTGNWRAERGDTAGTTDNNYTQHVMNCVGVLLY